MVDDYFVLITVSSDYPDGWVGIGRRGRLGPQRATQMAAHIQCALDSTVYTARLKGALRGKSESIYLFPTSTDINGVKYDLACIKCDVCRKENRDEKGRT